MLIPIPLLLFGITQQQLQQANITELKLEKSQQKTASFHVQILEKPQQKPKSINVKAKILGSSLTNLQTCFVLLKIKNEKAPKIGDTIALKAKLFPLPSPPLEGQFDYANYLRFQGISYQLRTNDWKLINNNTNFSLRAYAAYCQDYLFAKLQNVLKNKDATSLAAAVLLGNKDALDPSLKKAFQEAGAIHMLAVSGMHTGILFIVLCFIFRVQPSGFKKQILKKTIILMLLWFFALLTGFNPGVVRACTMFSLLMLSAIIKRNNELFHHLCLSCFLMLLYNSNWLFDIGFQLSYAALTGIALLQKPLASCIKSKHKIIQYAVSLVSVSIAAQLTCLPFILYYFHSFPTYFLISNLILLPFLPLLVYGGMFLLLMDTFSIEMSFLYICYENMLIVFNKAVVFIASLPYASTKALYPSISQTLILGVSIYLFAQALIYKQFKLLKFVCLLCLFIQTEELFQQQYIQNNTFLLLHNNRSATFYYISKGIAHVKSPSINDYEHHMMQVFFESKNIQLSKKQASKTNNNELHSENHAFIWWQKNYALSKNKSNKQYVIILSKNNGISASDLKKIPIAMLIADSSNSAEQILKWEKNYQQLQIPFYAAKDKYLWIQLE